MGQHLCYTRLPILGHRDTHAKGSGVLLRPYGIIVAINAPLCEVLNATYDLFALC
jgi:hypothetical protein